MSNKSTKMAWMPLYPTDYLADTFDLTAEEHGVYMVLLMCAWHLVGCVLPADRTVLTRLLQSKIADFHHRKAHTLLDKILPRFFVLTEAGFVNERQGKEADKASIKAVKAADNAAKRWGKSLKNNDTADADAMHRAPVSESESESPYSVSKDTAPPQADEAGSASPVHALEAKAQAVPSAQEQPKASPEADGLMGIDPKERLFGDKCRAYLSEDGRKSDANVRSSIGQMLKLLGGDSHAGALLGIVADAHRQGKADPLGWCMGVVKKQREAVLATGQNGSKSGGTRPAQSSWAGKTSLPTAGR
jgi:uncharacterized protein YdaU (DUF1376 family)